MSLAFLAATDAVSDSVLVAIITSVSGVVSAVLIYLLRRLETINTTQHAENKAVLNNVQTGLHQAQLSQVENGERIKSIVTIAEDTNVRVRTVDDRLQAHIQWHADHNH